MQFPRDVQPLLVRPAPRGLLPGAFGFLRPPLGLPQRLPGGERGDQPGDLQDAAGLRERVTALGGRRCAEPRGGGGFTVQAELPVDRTS